MKPTIFCMKLQERDFSNVSFVIRHTVIPLIAQVSQDQTVNNNSFGQDIGDITGDAAFAADLASKGFDNLWKDTLNGHLYASIANVGTLFAVGTLLIFLIQWIKAMLESEHYRPMSEMIWPLVVIILLSSHGKILAGATLGLREMIQQTNQTMLETVTASVRLQEAYQTVMRLNGDIEAIRKLQEQCAQISNPTQQKECYENNQKKADEIIKSAQRNILFQRINILEQTKESLGRILRIPQSVIQTVFRIVLFSIGYAYQWIIEISLLITALFGPLAVGGSLLPMAKKPIISWLTAMFSIGLAKLSYNMICGLVAIMMFNSAFFDPMIFPIIVGFFAPILSVCLATGGGLSILNGITNIGSLGISTLINVTKISLLQKSAPKSYIDDE